MKNTQIPLPELYCPNFQRLIDIIGVSADPLLNISDLSHNEFVMKDGIHQFLSERWKIGKERKYRGA